MAVTDFVLPQFLSLKIINMTTFPKDLRISFYRGPNVIFGGNHSGKTTIVNSLKYGVFGLSWNQTTENMEQRYFVNRIKENERKSLEINTVFDVKPDCVAINRTVFSSGTAEISATISEGAFGSLSNTAKRISHEKHYYDMLREKMGLPNVEHLKFIPSLVFAEESRQPILWSKNLESFVLSLLASKENLDRLRLIDAQLSKAKKDLDKLIQNRESLARKAKEKVINAEFLRMNLTAIEQTGADKYIEQYKSVKNEFDTCSKNSDKLNEDLSKKFLASTVLQSRLSSNQNRLLRVKAEQDELSDKMAKAFLNPDDPKETHFGRYFYYEKKCPFCLSNLSEEINSRITNGKCAICGKGELVDYGLNLQEIENNRLKLNELENELNASNKTVEQEISQINKKIETLMNSLNKERIRENELGQRIGELKSTEENMHRKNVLSAELGEVQQLIESNQLAISKNEQDITNVQTEIEEIIQLQDETQSIMKVDTNLTLSRIRSVFSNFIKAATNDELTGEISTEFIPSLNGRPIFHPEQASQFERTLMDLAFRLGLLSVFAEKSGTIPSLVIETPDEVTDESYIPYLAEAIESFSASLSVIVTTVNLDMMEHLLKNYEPAERKKRFVDLVSNGTFTQQKYYQLFLVNYLSGEK